jgi:hypothetical protein
MWYTVKPAAIHLHKNLYRLFTYLLRSVRLFKYFRLNGHLSIILIY